MIPRTLNTYLHHVAAHFPVLACLGPRQSGKTTLVRAAFPGLPYVSLENLDTRAFAQSDPRGFLATYPEGAIFDEVQRVPLLLSYLLKLRKDIWIHIPSVLQRNWLIKQHRAYVIKS